MSAELWTGRYATFDPSRGAPIAITVGLPKFKVGYEIKHRIRELAPWGEMKLEDHEFVAAYRRRLGRLDIDELARRFEKISAEEGGQPLVLLCFEAVHAGELCHRRVFADWWQERTGQAVREVERLTPEAEAEVRRILRDAAGRLQDQRLRANTKRTGET